MKKLLLFYLILLGIAANGQNYRCLQPGVKNFFVNSDGYLRGIRIDSVKTYSDSTVFYPYRTPRGPVNGAYFTIVDSFGGSWLGKKVIELNDGTTIFDSYWKDSVIIKTQANVGDSWTLYNDSGSTYYTATVISEDTLTIFSALDSVKYIRVNAFNSFGPLIYDPVDSLTIILSKNHGFAKVVDLYTFPYHKADSTYRPGLDFFLDRPMQTYGFSPAFNVVKMVFNIIDFVNPNDQQMYNWQVGDVLESLNKCGTVPIYAPERQGYLLTTVASRSVTGHDVNYTLTGSNSVFFCMPYFPHVLINIAGSKTFSDLNYTILKPEDMPEEHYGFNRNFIFYYPNDNRYCFAGPAYELKPLIHMYGLGSFTTITRYKSGLGMAYYYHIDGEPSFEEHDLTYYEWNGTSCGVFVGIEKIDKRYTTVYPNPAADELVVKTLIDGPYTIALQNMLGQVVKTVRTYRSEEMLAVKDLANGLYIVNIIDGEGNKSSHKVAIQH